MVFTIDTLLFQVLPYVPVALFIIEAIRRYRQRPFSYSSLSSQFLEGDRLFIGSVPWHYGILFVLGGHLFAFLFPRELIAFGSVPWRLLILEVTALIGGLVSLIGLVELTIRRLTRDRIRAVTNVMDLVVLGVLLTQVGLGVYIALTMRWGSMWFATIMAPYLKSVLLLQPNVDLVSVLPWVIKLHIVGAYVFLAILPYSRLVHMLVWPVHYLFRRPQVVIWNAEPGSLRSTGEPERGG